MMGRQNRQMAMILVDIESLMVCKQFYPNIQSESPRPCPAPGDTGVFRERGRTAGICRVESTAASQQHQTRVAKRREHFNVAPTYLCLAKTQKDGVVAAIEMIEPFELRYVYGFDGEVACRKLTKIAKIILDSSKEQGQEYSSPFSFL